MTITMAFAISSSSSLSSSSPCYFPNPRNSINPHIKCIPQLGLSHWNGLKLMPISVSQFSVKIVKRGRKGKGVYASLFGVGAPEVLVIGVVALLVFGPKGLAEVARNLGKTLRAFQPTIRELQDVSREFKSTLEREIGLDDIDNPVPKRSSPNTATNPTSEEKPETLGTDLEPNDSSTENGKDSIDDSLQLRADLFRGTLAQLQKEREEEKEREKEKAQIDVELQTPSPDTPPQASETPPEDLDSSVTPPSQNPDGNALQETTSVVLPTGPGPKTESQT